MWSLPSPTSNRRASVIRIVPAMGSHAGGTAEGQRELIEGYGITEAFCECPIKASMETLTKASHKVAEIAYQAQATSSNVVLALWLMSN